MKNILVVIALCSFIVSCGGKKEEAKADTVGGSSTTKPAAGKIPDVRFHMRGRLRGRLIRLLREEGCREDEQYCDIQAVFLDVQHFHSPLEREVEPEQQAARGVVCGGDR